MCGEHLPIGLFYKSRVFAYYSVVVFIGISVYSNKHAIVLLSQLTLQYNLHTTVTFLVHGL